VEPATSAAVPARARAGDGGIAPAPPARHPTTQAVGPTKPRASAVDSGVAALAGESRPVKPTQAPPIPGRGDGAARFRRDDDGDHLRVARFLEAGGSDLEGRVVDVDTGRAVAGISVEARFEGRAVEVETDDAGAFSMRGLVPGSKVLVWIGGRRDHMVAERFDVRIPDDGKKADLGVIKLLNGNEVAPQLDGWIGIYLTRRDERVRVNAVNAWVPASRAGIEVGDIILSVNGRDVREVGPRTVGFLLRGPIGSALTLEVESGNGKRRKLTLQRVTH
jgi:hypothetical protein